MFVLYIGFSSGSLKTTTPPLEVRWILDRIWMVFTVLPYLAGAVYFSAEYGKAEDPIVRQQLKWLPPSGAR